MAVCFLKYIVTLDIAFALHAETTLVTKGDLAFGSKISSNSWISILRRGDFGDDFLSIAFSGYSQINYQSEGAKHRRGQASTPLHFTLRKDVWERGYITSKRSQKAWSQRFTLQGKQIYILYIWYYKCFFFFFF